ncbi:MAG: hypothetical protein FJ030_04010 [Chloroflexi bacterium]|nr:hypothetical protein [Chloroflexota bacterium]
MSDYAIPSDVIQQLEEVATDEHRNVAELLGDIVRAYIARRHDEKISAETARFRAAHAEIRAAYADRYIAMRDGKVLDHDSDVSLLRQRVRGQYGNAAILIAFVASEPVQEFRIRRPRVERIGS